MRQSRLTLVSDRYAYIIGSILFGAIKRNPVTHIKSTNEILVTKHVSIISLSTKMRTAGSFFSMQPMKN